ncbi:MAG: hypothetical protein AAGC54_11190 [Cyanobacteria bacterium P01_F01_bin.4]
MQTYLRLKETGFPCELTDRLPEQGIVLFHRNVVLKADISPGPSRLLICLKADISFFSGAQLHVVQNPREASPQLGSYFIPHWPQPGLLPRQPDRGNCFETVAFFGHQVNLDPALNTSVWQTQLAQRGLRWVSIANTNRWNDYATLNNGWNDYRQIDAIVGVRQFQARRPLYRRKPATKLYNAWLAGVPAVLGREWAYRVTGQAGVNYLEANSVEAVLHHLERLKQDVAWRQSLVEAGRIQSVAYQPEVITQRWRQFLKTVAVPAYQHWCQLNRAQRCASLVKSVLINYCDRAVHRLVG